MTAEAHPKAPLLEQFALVAKALANAKRLEMLDVLVQAERSVEALAQATDLKLTTASAHLQTLRQGGLVSVRKEGTRIFYRVAGPEVARLMLELRRVAIENLAEARRAAQHYLGEDEFEAVGRDELLERMSRGDLIVLDVRPRVEYDAGHIEGAVSIPVDELRERVRELPKATDVVAYCRGDYCVYAYDAVRLLRGKGRRARRMSGGMVEWRLEDRPSESGG